MPPTSDINKLIGKRLPRILVIDDNQSIHRDFDTVLVDEGHDSELEADEQRTFGPAGRLPLIAPVFNLDHAYSGMEGIKKVELSLKESNPYQLAFVDIRMPGIDGVEAIERIWKLDPRIQTVICTAYADYSQTDLMQRLGFTDKLLVLRKPFDSIEVTQLAITLTEKWYLAVQAELKLEQMEALVAHRTQQLLQIQGPGMECVPTTQITENELSSGSDADIESPLVLLIESDPDVCRQMERDLGNGFRLLEVLDCAQGLDAARENVPDLVLANLRVGQLCQKLKDDEVTSHIPVMLFSVPGRGPEPVRAIEAGADDYFAFPLHSHLLRVRVTRLLNLRRKTGRPADHDSLNPREIASNQMDFQFLRRAIAVIDQNMSDFEFDVEALSQKMFMSRRQFFRKIKAVTGAAPYLLIRNLRLKRAAQLLKESPLTVTEITYAVGFSDLKHFRTIFKECFGVLPGEYAGGPDDQAGSDAGESPR